MKVNRFIIELYRIAKTAGKTIEVTYEQDNIIGQTHICVSKLDPSKIIRPHVTLIAWWDRDTLSITSNHWRHGWDTNRTVLPQKFDTELATLIVNVL